MKDNGFQNEKSKDLKKINANSLKMFQLLKLLYDDEATYERVVEILSDEVPCPKYVSNKTQVLLNKHINTLKIFGLKVVKENHKFKLQSSLYSMKFSPEDLKAMSILMTFVSDFPDKSLSVHIRKFIEMLEVRMNNQDKNTLNNLISNINYDFSFYYRDLREQINQCLEICNKKSEISVLYLENKKEIRIKCNPKEVIYDSKTAYLKVYNTKARRNIDIPLQNILSIAMLPTQMNSVETTQTVVFKLKGRLAKTYKMRPGEKLIDNDENSRVYSNTDEPFDSLIERFMRYSFDCEVLSPKNLREKMINLINETLNQYE